MKNSEADKHQTGLRLVQRTAFCNITSSVLLIFASSGPAAANEVRATIEAELPEVHVIATSPVGGTAIPLSKFAGNVQTINHSELPNNAQNIADVLNQSIGSININDTQGNPYNVDLNYRGFTSSPVLGTPQGISVFLDGMRINEPFGDTVAWDLVPQIAIANATLIPGSNPVYGLNTLGGAVALNTKSGFSFPGTNAKVTLGSYQRRSIDAEQGGHGENTDYYVAASLYDDKGWALYNPSQVRQFFSKFGFQDNQRDIDFSIAFNDNDLHGNQSVPVSMLSNAKQGYTHSDYTKTQNLTLNLKGSLELDEEHSIAGNVYYRYINRDILNSNLNGDGSSPQLTCTPGTDCIAANLLAASTQNILGSNLQWSNTQKLWGKSQVFTAGLNAEYGHTSFGNNGQYAVLDSNNGLVGVGSYLSQASVKSTNTRMGLFATDTLDATERMAVTMSARYDYAAIKLSGTSCANDEDLCGFNPGSDTLTDVSGNHSYTRLNPSIGATYKLTPETTGFANYAEGFRTPSAIELACADPTAPCSGIPNAFGADPALKAVISKTFEFGMRGNIGDELSWRAAVFQTQLNNDILFNMIGTTQGYFSNVGQTLRRGIELGFQGKKNAFDYAVNGSWISATFETPFAIANTANSSSSTDAKAGDHIPGIPSLILKTHFGYAFTPETHVSLTTLTQSSQYARGDENNLDANGKVPGFTTLKLDASHKLDKTFEMFGGIINLLDARYAGYGVVANNNLVSGGPAEQFRSLGAPRTFYLGMRGSY